MINMFRVKYGASREFSYGPGKETLHFGANRHSRTGVVVSASGEASFWHKAEVSHNIHRYAFSWLSNTSIEPKADGHCG